MSWRGEIRLWFPRHLKAPLIPPDVCLLTCLEKIAMRTPVIKYVSNEVFSIYESRVGDAGKFSKRKLLSHDIENN